jgi:predicted aminopeptidase
MRPVSLLPLLGYLGLMVLLTGCGTVGYYAQAVKGQYQILHREQSIQKLLADPRTSDALKERLNRALAIRGFAEKELHLPANGHYKHYADLGRRFAVWTVYAAPEFSLRAKKWWYPVVGRLEYQGYFDEAKARRFAGMLEGRGLDTHVGGVEAYSTLGWFRDPLLNTFLFEDELDLTELLFHELAHQRLFMAGDTEFNEAFATAVAEEGVERWLRARGDEALIVKQRLAAARKQVFLELVSGARARLKTLYAEAPEQGCGCSCEGGSTDCVCARLRVEKAAVFKDLRASYAAAKERWGGEREYDGWFEQELNNALLNTVETYYALVPEFRRRIEAAGGNLEEFYKGTEALGKLKKEERHRILRERGK